MNRRRVLQLAGQSDEQRLTRSVAEASGSLQIVVAGIGTTGAISTFTAPAIQTAVRALGGAVAASVVAVGTGYWSITTAGTVGNMSVTNDTTLDAGGNPVTHAVTRVTSFIDALTPVTSITADLSQTGDELTLVATAAGQSVVNGSNLKLAADWTSSAANDSLTVGCADGVNWVETSRKVQPDLSAGSAYRTIENRGGLAAGGTTAGTRYLLPSGVPVVFSATTAAQTLFYFDPAEYAAPTGKTLKLCVFALVLSNNTDSTSIFTFGMIAASAPAGASGTISFTAGALVTGSTIALTPGANGSPSGNSGDFTAPSAGLYALRIATTNNQAAGGDVNVRVALKWRHV